MPRYNVRLEVRKDGALGVFATEIFTVDAIDSYKANLIALRNARFVHGLEPRNTNKIEES